MDFDPMPDLEIDGYRIALIDEFGDHPEGDAFLIHPDGTQVDLTWEAEVAASYCWKWTTIYENGHGVWWVGVTEPVTTEADLRGVLQAVVDAIKSGQPDRPLCPRCGSQDTIPIVYGMPGPELMDAAKQGSVALGGCMVWPDQPTDQCRDCEATFAASEPS